MLVTDYSWLLDWLPANRPIHLLDIGCSDCPECETLLNAGITLTGVDQDETAIREASQRRGGGRFLTADAAALPKIQPDGFDAVLIRRPDLFAQPTRWRQIFLRLPDHLQMGASVTVTTIGKKEAATAAQWLEDSGFAVTRSVSAGPEGEREIITAHLLKAVRPAAKSEAVPNRARVIQWDDDPGLACDTTTGVCATPQTDGDKPD